MADRKKSLSKRFSPRYSKTRIVCTAGPACADVEVLTALVRAGCDVVRVNGAHAGAKDIGLWARRLREVRRLTKYPVGLMVDLPGIKMRTGLFVSGTGVDLVAGTRVELFPGTQGGTATRIPVHPYPELSGLRKGVTVLLDDVRARAQPQVKSVAQDNLGTDGANIPWRHTLHSAVGAHGHKGRSLHRAA